MQTNNRMGRGPAWALALLLALTGLASALPAAQAAEKAVVKIPAAQVAEQVRVAVQEMVDRQVRVPGQGQVVVVQVKLAHGGKLLQVNFSSEFIPRQYGADFQDLLDELFNVAYDLVRERSSIQDIEFTFAGHSFEETFPEQASQAGPNKLEPNMAGSVLVAGGHGLYYHYKFKDWRAQRDTFNGITEDFITPTLVAELNTWLGARSQAATFNPRSTLAGLHAPSGQPWWKVSARYHLEATLPDHPEIWHSLPNDTSNLRERNEDINSRPLYANYLGAGAAFHLHTNGVTNGPSPSGTRVFYATKRPADAVLGSSVLCYMGELIHAREGYENWTVPRTAESRKDLGELNKANMPSLIVEVGFHTNASDAVALKDPVFVTAAMKGVEKGYRLHGEGKDCQQFKVPKIENVTGLQNQDIPIKVPFKGFPEFTVTAIVDIVSCPPGWTCTGGQVPFTNKQASPLKYTFICNTNGKEAPITVGLRTTLQDIDQVKTEPVVHTVTCLPTGVAPRGGSDRQQGPSLRILSA